MDKKQWLQSVGMRDPIELAFSKLKAHLKRLAPRTVEALWKNTGQIVSMYTTQECKNYFAQMVMHQNNPEML